jgi:hypothetical protein
MIVRFDFPTWLLGPVARQPECSATNRTLEPPMGLAYCSFGSGLTLSELCEGWRNALSSFVAASFHC